MLFRTFPNHQRKGPLVRAPGFSVNWRPIGRGVYPEHPCTSPLRCRHTAFGAPAGLGRRLWLRITNDRNIVTIHHSPDGQHWTKFYVQMEVSGYNHNVAYDFLSLRPGIYAAGDGEVTFRNLRYRALPDEAEGTLNQ